MATEGVDIELRVKIDKLREELMKIPGISKDSAEGMLRAYSTEYKKLEQAAEKASRKAKQEAEKTAAAWKGSAEQVATLMGGAFGDVADSVFALGEKLSTATSGMTGFSGAVAATGAGLTAFAFAGSFAYKATKEWLDTLPAVIASLREWEGLEPIGAADIAALKDYAEASSDLDAAMARASVVAGAQLAPAMTGLTHAMIGALDAAEGLSDWMDGVGLISMEELGRNMANSGVLTAALLQAYDHLSARGEVLAQATTKISDAQRGLNDEIRQTNDEAEAMLVALGLLDPATKRNEGSTKRLADEVDKLAEARRKEQDAMRAATADAVAQADERARYEGAAARMQIADREALERTHQAALTAIRTEGTQAAIALEQELAAGQQAALQTVRDQATANALTAIEMLAAAQIEAIGREIDSRRTAHRANMAALETQRETIKARLEDGKITAAQAAEQLAAIDAREARQRAVNKAARDDEAKALKAAFIAQKAAAISQVIMQAAIATLALTAGLAYLGPGAPAAALAITAPLAATQVGLIAAEKPPKFATGGMVGEMDPVHRFVAATPREGILTERGVDAVGGPQGLEALNRGESMGGGGVSAVMLDGAVLGAAVVQTLRNDASVRREMARRSGLVPGQRARYSGRG